MDYKPNRFEQKWQKKWQDDKLYQADNGSSKEPCFVVDMFPYPSGNSMHVGHPRGYVATDVYSRFKRMQGFNVLHPMGWDAFGLPAEETAILNKEYPSLTVERNIQKFKSQLIMLGLGYDWSREINTTDPGYYVHTQRIFLEFFKRGLARNATMAVNWCPALGTVLANEDIVDGKSERGNHPIYQRPMRQWVLSITKYADRLVDDLDLLPHWPEKIKTAQKNWIGRSEGHEFSFVTDIGICIRVFTTQIETLPGATFIVLAPEHELVRALIESASNAEEISNYVKASSQKSDLERQVSKNKTGVVIADVMAMNPFTKTKIPIVIADYVLASYGTGAIMAVPAHDSRDAEMAQILLLPSLEVVKDEKLVNASFLNGESISQARKKITNLVEAESKKQYKIRDWVFSRQRFWGEPFPIVWIEGEEAYDLIKNGPVRSWLPSDPIFYRDGVTEYFAVPVVPEFLDSMSLPRVTSYEPTGTMDGPLAGIDNWVHAFMNPDTGEVSNTAKSKGWIPVRRETNTMPQWAGSSWYWLRYMDPDNDKQPYSKEAAKYWGAVNVYAGADHAVAHLIYARFWHKMMQDAGMVDFPEPFERLEFLGYILAADGTKISKRKGNSRSPEDIVKEVGADAFRMYEMFIGPFEKSIPWSDSGLTGTHRFLEKVWKLAHIVVAKNASVSDPNAVSAIHRSIHKVGNDIEQFRFNTAVSSLMICLNEIATSEIAIADFKLFIILMAPFAPHIAEELWVLFKESNSIHMASWPATNQSLILEPESELPIQINGRLRLTMRVPKMIAEEELKLLVLGNDQVKKFLAGSEPNKFIYVPGRIINILM